MLDTGFLDDLQPFQKSQLLLRPVEDESLAVKFEDKDYPLGILVAEADEGLFDAFREAAIWVSLWRQPLPKSVGRCLSFHTDDAYLVAVVVKKDQVGAVVNPPILLGFTVPRIETALVRPLGHELPINQPEFYFPDLLLGKEPPQGSPFRIVRFDSFNEIHLSGHDSSPLVIPIPSIISGVLQGSATFSDSGWHYITSSEKSNPRIGAVVA